MHKVYSKPEVTLGGKNIQWTLVPLFRVHYCGIRAASAHTLISFPAVHLLYHCVWMSTEGATTFKCFKTTDCKQNLIYEIIKSELNSGNAYCHRVQDLPSSCPLFTYLFVAH